MKRNSAAPNDSVVTGLGVVAANGVGRDALAAALVEGRTGIDELVSFDAEDLGRGKAAEIVEFDEQPFLRSPKNFLDRNSALAFTACEMAVRESGLLLPDPSKASGIAVGSLAANIETLSLFHAKVREKGPRLAPPFLFPHTYCNTSAGLLSIEYGLGGPHQTFCSHVAGLEAVAFAARAVQEGRADAMIAGGAEAFSEPLFRLAAAQEWLSPVDGREESCRPFDTRRNGAILGEGAAFFSIESREAAEKRDARILAEIRSLAVATSAPAAIRMALERAKLGPEDIDAVFAAAGGYAATDEHEATAFMEVFGEQRAPVVALKSLIGETLGAAGALNLAATLIALDQNILPPVPEDLNNAFDRLNLVREPRPAPLKTLLLNAAGPLPGTWITAVVSRPATP